MISPPPETPTAGLSIVIGCCSSFSSSTSTGWRCWRFWRGGGPPRRRRSCNGGNTIRSFSMAAGELSSDVVAASGAWCCPPPGPAPECRRISCSATSSTRCRAMKLLVILRRVVVLRGLTAAAATAVVDGFLIAWASGEGLQKRKKMKILLNIVLTVAEKAPLLSFCIRLHRLLC